MATLRIFLSVFLVSVFTTDIFAAEDLPCAAREVDGESVVCVCNSTYCDTINRDAPSAGTFVAYTSSEAGLRFYKTNGSVEAYNSSSSASETIVLDTSTVYQTIQGFGGAVTDSAGINWKNLSEPLQQLLIDSYYSDVGLQYNMMRVPIGGTDFSTRAYTYNDLPVDDTSLSNFTLAAEDYDYKIPVIRAAINASSTDIHIVATVWSPPTWMKSNDDYSGFSRLKSDYYQTYADYHLKFLESYAAENISIWAITTTNEPFNGIVPLNEINSLGWTAYHMGKYIINNLGPTIRNSTFNATKILINDDQRYVMANYVIAMVVEHPEVLDWIDGIAVHWYGDFFTPALVLTTVAHLYPEKFMLATEACEGSFPWQDAVVLGSWDRAESYTKSIIEDLSHSLVGWIDWNICLNPSGGPTYIDNNVDSPILVYADEDEFVKQPMFYAMGHFSKFVPRGSIRIAAESSDSDIETLAFVTPSNTTVVVFYNDNDSATEVQIQVEEKQVIIDAAAKSISTVELLLD